MPVLSKGKIVGEGVVPGRNGCGNIITAVTTCLMVLYSVIAKHCRRSDMQF